MALTRGKPEIRESKTAPATPVFWKSLTLLASIAVFIVQGSALQWGYTMPSTPVFPGPSRLITALKPKTKCFLFHPLKVRLPGPSRVPLKECIGPAVLMCGSKKVGESPPGTFFFLGKVNIHRDLLETVSLFCFQMERSDQKWLFELI